MSKLTQRILLLIYLVINLLFIEKYATRVTEYHLGISLVYLLAIICSLEFFSKRIAKSAHATIGTLGLGFLLLIIGICIQYHISPYSIQVDRWSAIHNFLAAMQQGDYPYGASTHLGGYGSPFPVWQIFHLPFYHFGNVGLSIFVVTIAFIATIHRFHSNKAALLSILLLGMSPTYWYEVAVRSDLITNMLLVATITEWLLNKRAKLSHHTFFIGLLTGLLLSTRLIAVIPLCMMYGYEFLHLEWKKKAIFVLTVIVTFVLTFLPFIFWKGSTLFFFEYNPFVLQTRQGSWMVLLIFAVIAILVTLCIKGNNKHLPAATGVLLTMLVGLAFVEKMWLQNLWGGLFTSTFDITYLSTALPFYIIYLSRSILSHRQL